jgi:hypothetical protein
MQSISGTARRGTKEKNKMYQGMKIIETEGLGTVFNACNTSYLESGYWEDFIQDQPG